MTQASTKEENNRKLARYLISEIRSYMRDTDFQRDFFESVAEQFEVMGSITQPQLDAINRIYERLTR